MFLIGELAYSTLWHRHFETRQHLDLYAVVVVVVVVVATIIYIYIIYIYAYFIAGIQPTMMGDV